MDLQYEFLSERVDIKKLRDAVDCALCPLSCQTQVSSYLSMFNRTGQEMGKENKFMFYSR